MNPQFASQRGPHPGQNLQSRNLAKTLSANRFFTPLNLWFQLINTNPKPYICLIPPSSLHAGTSVTTGKTLKTSEQKCYPWLVIQRPPRIRAGGVQSRVLNVTILEILSHLLSGPALPELSVGGQSYFGLITYCPLISRAGQLCNVVLKIGLCGN